MATLMRGHPSLKATFSETFLYFNVHKSQTNDHLSFLHACPKNPAKVMLNKRGVILCQLICMRRKGEVSENSTKSNKWNMGRRLLKILLKKKKEKKRNMMKGFLKNPKNQTKEMCEGPQIKQSKQYGKVSENYHTQNQAKETWREGFLKFNKSNRKCDRKVSENSITQTKKTW